MVVLDSENPIEPNKPTLLDVESTFRLLMVCPSPSKVKPTFDLLKGVHGSLLRSISRSRVIVPPLCTAASAAAREVYSVLPIFATAAGSSANAPTGRRVISIRIARSMLRNLLFMRISPFFRIFHCQGK